MKKRNIARTSKSEITTKKLLEGESEIPYEKKPDLCKEGRVGKKRKF